ncbi:transporter [Ganoderma sinense ZZ0214-1]|uniref:Transporter n=1 Tax=Ganoderma sinense ZZ0214-1 TaxID=1077348 RepID=A0A2G8RQE2_9APHY|nr:transporter [Ganoderma sinense ZZ0214-1]
MQARKRKGPADTNVTEAGEEGKKEKGTGDWRKPSNTPFKQQRLRAWHPLFVPRTVIPALLVVGIILAPIGILLIWGSNLVNEIDIDYSNCEFTPAQNDTSSSSLSFTNLSSSSYIYKLSVVNSHTHVDSPQYAFINRTGALDATNATKQQCVLRFDVPTEIKAPVMLYYKLTNFNQNHRRYVKSVSLDQLLGKKPSDTSLLNDCKPLDKDNNHKVIYPCGMIANSMFNDTFTNLTRIDGDESSNPPLNSTYLWSEKNIAWPGEARKYVTKPGYAASDIVPPPFWMERFPDGYTDDNLPDLKSDEHFQNWMRTAGLPTFSKLWGRNDDSALSPGRYEIWINLNFPVTKYKGTKSIVISSAAWMGGKNPFLGWTYVAGSSLLLLLGFVVAIINCIKPRFVFHMCT